LQLKHEGITTPILILGYTPPECASILYRYDISQCIYSYEYAQKLHAFLKEGEKIKAHIKIDTGMGRLGYTYDSELSAVGQICDTALISSLEIEGIFTHFAVSDCGEKGRAFTVAQYRKFNEIIEALESRGVTFKYKHCSNSAATVEYPEMEMNMIRAGLILYGLTPSDEVGCNDEFKAVMSLKSVVSHIKEIGIGDTVSYGCDFVADRTMRIATVPMGYADGFERSNAKNNVFLTVKGKKAPIIGRICMDQLMLDVTDVDIAMGDVVTVFGDNSANTADTLAAADGTINYEIICSIGKRVPRVFIRDGKIDGIHLGFLDTTIS
jgi:alanine racemase